MTPEYRIEADGQDITAVIAAHLVSITVTDEVGHQSDKLAITLADPKADIAVPPTGARLAVWIGYRGKRLAYRGAYVVDEISFEGPAVKIEITARAADMGGEIKAPRSRTWSNTTLAAISQTIARQRGLVPVVGPGLDQMQMINRDQTSESDLNFLTRIATEHDVVMKITDGQLRIARRAEAINLDGSALPVIAIAPKTVTAWRQRVQDRGGGFGAVVARYRHVPSGQIATAKAGAGVPVLELREVHPDQTTARNAANARMKHLARGRNVADLDAIGLPEIYAGAPIEITDQHPAIDGRWSVTRVTHTVNRAGYTTKIKAEAPNT